MPKRKFIRKSKTVNVDADRKDKLIATWRKAGQDRSAMVSRPDDYVMPFGKYKGQTLDNIASTDAGLLYLDWAAGEFEEGQRVTEAIWAYLEIESVRRDLDAAIDRRDDKYDSGNNHYNGYQ